MTEQEHKSPPKDISGLIRATLDHWLERETEQSFSLQNPVVFDKVRITEMEYRHAAIALESGMQKGELVIATHDSQTFEDGYAISRLEDIKQPDSGIVIVLFFSENAMDNTTVVERALAGLLEEDIRVGAEGVTRGEYRSSSQETVVHWENAPKIN